jgi:hypothetical protein
MGEIGHPTSVDRRDQPRGFSIFDLVVGTVDVGFQISSHCRSTMNDQPSTAAHFRYDRSRRCASVSRESTHADH